MPKQFRRAIWAPAMGALLTLGVPSAHAQGRAPAFYLDLQGYDIASGLILYDKEEAEKK